MLTLNTSRGIPAVGLRVRVVTVLLHFTTATVHGVTLHFSLLQIYGALWSATRGPLPCGLPQQDLRRELSV